MATIEAGTAAVGPPRPEPDEITRFFWEGVDAHRLMILRCNSCRRYVHLPREVCRYCLSTDLEPERVSGRGVLETFTVPSQPFHAWFRDRVPYVLGIVELDEQKDLKLVTNIVDIDEEDIYCGLRVHVVFRQVAPGYTLPLFAPDDTGREGAGR